MPRRNQHLSCLEVWIPQLLDVVCGSHYVGTSRCVVFAKIHFTSSEVVTEMLSVQWIKCRLPNDNLDE